MNNLRDKLLKAGLITENQKKRVDFEEEARRAFVTFEGKASYFSEQLADAFAKRTAERAINSDVPFSKMWEFVSQTIQENKEATAAFARDQAVERARAIYIFNPRAVVESQKH